MTPRLPKLPPTVTVHRHHLTITYIPNSTANRTWTITEHLGTVTVGPAPLHYDHGTFTTETSTGIVTDPDWITVLERAFARS